MSKLELHRDQPGRDLAVNLRRAFSGIVAGNVREAGIRLVENHGPFELKGDPKILGALDRLLKDFVAQRRMRLSSNYLPVLSNRRVGRRRRLRKYGANYLY